jgi:hypothetical protein
MMGMCFMGKRFDKKFQDQLGNILSWYSWECAALWDKRFDKKLQDIQD